MPTTPTAVAAPDTVGLSWLVTVRWTTLIAGAGAVVAGRSTLETAAPVVPAVALLVTSGLSNLWLVWRIRSNSAASPATIAGLLMCADVVLLTWLLWKSGGVLNPASVFYLVQIVVSALVLGRTWTWIVTSLSVVGYATLFLAPSEDLGAAQMMHPEIQLHMRGMWIAFALTAVIIGILVTRLAIAVERRDRALDVMRERSQHAARVASLATMAAGAAHELGTPLATIAVAARELERALADAGQTADLGRDAALIRAETDRCRQILEAMAAQSGEPGGETPQATTFGNVLAALGTRLGASDAARMDLQLGGASAEPVRWPVHVVARALTNLVRNAIQASAPNGHVRVEAGKASNGVIRISVGDTGSGMTPDVLARAGEPFFTTKPAGTGTGLGLFVARSSVEQLGGSLAIDSLPGRGTTVTLIIPTDVVSDRSRHA